MCFINKSERDLISAYLYVTEERLIENVNLAEYRCMRRELDSVDLLEEILAKERLNSFKDFAFDITRLLKLDESNSEYTKNLRLVSAENCTPADKIKYNELMRFVKSAGE